MLDAPGSKLDRRYSAMLLELLKGVFPQVILLLKPSDANHWFGLLGSSEFQSIHLVQKNSPLAGKDEFIEFRGRELPSTIYNSTDKGTLLVKVEV